MVDSSAIAAFILKEEGVGEVGRVPNDVHNPSLAVKEVAHPQDDIMDKALEIALRRRITVYNALYISLAKITDSTLVTLDEEQAKVAIVKGVKYVTP